MRLLPDALGPDHDMSLTLRGDECPLASELLGDELSNGDESPEGEWCGERMATGDEGATTGTPNDDALRR